MLELGASNPQIPGRGPLRTLHATMDLSGPMRADGDSRRPRLGQEEEGERLREVESRAARHRAAAEEEAAAAAMRRSWGQAEAAASNTEAAELLGTTPAEAELARLVGQRAASQSRQRNAEEDAQLRLAEQHAAVALSRAQIDEMLVAHVDLHHETADFLRDLRSGLQQPLAPSPSPPFLKCNP